jgi:hypothetical protein
MEATTREHPPWRTLFLLSFSLPLITFREDLGLSKFCNTNVQIPAKNVPSRLSPFPFVPDSRFFSERNNTDSTTFMDSLLHPGAKDAREEITGAGQKSSSLRLQELRLSERRLSGCWLGSLGRSI